MKVSNCNIAKITAYSLVIMTTVMILCIFLNHQIILDILLFTSIILVIAILTKIKIVTYEFSGGCITIRKAHPFTFKKFISPEIEFPQNYILDYNVNNHIVSGSLALKVKSRNKKYTVKTKLFGFTQAQHQSISSSLISIVSQNNFNRSN